MMIDFMVVCSRYGHTHWPVDTGSRELVETRRNLTSLAYPQICVTREALFGEDTISQDRLSSTGSRS